MGQRGIEISVAPRMDGMGVPASENPEDEEHDAAPANRYSKKIWPAWSRFTEGMLHKWIRKVIVTMGSSAARYPKTWILCMTVFGFSLATVGFFTNFQAEFEQRVFLTPQGSLTDTHSDWINEESGFEKQRVLWLALHSDGNNVITAKGLRRALITMDTILSVPDFNAVCSQSHYQDVESDEHTCFIYGPTLFWENNLTMFENQLAAVPLAEQDDFVRRYVSNETFSDGTPVFHEAILGNYQHKSITAEEGGVIVKKWLVYGAQSLVSKIDIPDLGPPTDKLELQLLEQLKVLQKMWRDEDEELQRHVSPPLDEMEPVVKLEFFTLNAYTQEFQRAMNQDIPLIFVLVVVMMAFTCLSFYRPNDKVQSRGLLGILSFITIGMSLVTGFGLMFLCGVPLTSAGIMVPFLVVGVGLDDTFIILGAYFHRRRDAFEPTTQSTEERNTMAVTVGLIEDTLDEVGVSIFMTTITTLLCFLVGFLTSSIPVVRWLSLYAGSTLGIDFIFQITYFIALLSLDERRVQANRRDFCFWIVVKDGEVAADADGEAPLSLNQPQKYADDADVKNIENESEVIGGCSEPSDCDFRHGDKVSELGPNNGSDEDDNKDKSDAGNKMMSRADAESVTNDSAVSFEKFVDDVDLEKTHPPQHLEAPSTQSTQDANDQWHSSQSSIASTSKTAQPSGHEEFPPSGRQQLEPYFTEKFMSWYADQLLKPFVKVFVIALFLAFFAGTVYSTTLLYQQFNVGDYVPKDSFLTSFMNSFSQYTSLQRYIGVYFRNVDQSDPEIQKQMSQYVEDLAALPEIGEPPAFFWVRDFPLLAKSAEAQAFGLDLESLSFNEQIDLALSIPQVRQVFGQDIVRDESGNITASRTFLVLRNIDFEEVTNQIRMLHKQRDVTLAQPANQGVEEMSFFSIDDMYFFWELYDITVMQLIYSTISSVVLVCFVTVLLIPHWSAMLFVLPLMIMLYFNLLGTMQFCGIKVNSITYFIVIMSIGLLCDFLMHILLKWYETPKGSRHEKVKYLLETMGASVFFAGFTTWLGTIPLAFSTTKVFMTVFISFLAIVTLGCAAGLILLPVLLSIWGPVEDDDYVAPHTKLAVDVPATSTMQTLCDGECKGDDGIAVVQADTQK